MVELVQEDLKTESTFGQQWLFPRTIKDWDMEYLQDLLTRVKDDYLMACYQEGLMMIDELRFFLGLTDNVPSIVGGEAPYMEDIHDMEVIE